MTVVINGTTGITNDGGYTGDGVVFADTTPANTLVTTTGGNVGIGTSSPAQLLHVNGAAQIATAVLTATGSLELNTTGSGDRTTYIDFVSSGAPGAVDYSARIIRNSGVNGTLDLFNTGTGALIFGTNNTERARIDSSGNLLVGATAADSGSRLLVRGASSTTSDYAVVIERANGGDILSCRNDGSVYLPATYGFTTGSAANVFIASDASLYRSTSSIKYKKNIKDAYYGLNDVLKLRPVTYEGKGEADSGKTFGGLIAEEVHEAGLAEFVQYAEDGTPDALAYGNMVSLCIKAIQEQQAIIQQLQADVAALKGA
jgi:hypothetical protein